MNDSTLMDDELRHLLHDVAHKLGPFSSDPLEHAHNLIEDHAERARKILEAAGLWVDDPYGFESEEEE